MEDLKQFIVEYILTNGQLPGFVERLEASKKYWIISSEPIVVYRGQGHSKPRIPRPEGTMINAIQNAVRPILSTSKDINNVIDFTDKSSCCIFEISVHPGIRYIDFTDFSNISLSDIYTFMENKKRIEGSDSKGVYPFNFMNKVAIFNDFKKRKEKEQEVLLDGLQGTMKSSGEDYQMDFDIVTDETRRKKIKNYKKISMRIIKNMYIPKSGGKRAKTRKITKKHFKRKTRK